MEATQTPEQEPDHSRLGIAAEILAFVGLALLSKYLLSLIFWRYAGPVSLLLTLAVLTVYLRFRGRSWSTFGLVPLRTRKARLLILPQAGFVLIAFAAVVALTTIAGPLLGLSFMKDVSTGVEDRWGDVAGSLPHYLLWLAIVWTAAAFGEEMFFRGYLVTRMQALFPGGGAGALIGAVVAVIIPALIFGYGHLYYQGWRGAVVTAGIGLAFGACFLLFRRNLWPLIFLHGVIDTLTFTAIFLRLE